LEDHEDNNEHMTWMIMKITMIIWLRRSWSIYGDWTWLFTSTVVEEIWDYQELMYFMKLHSFKWSLSRPIYWGMYKCRVLEIKTANKTNQDNICIGQLARLKCHSTVIVELDLDILGE